MQITEKVRHEILLSLPKLPTKDADGIAEKLEISRDTVYRQYKKLRDGSADIENQVVIELCELAASKREDSISNRKRVLNIMKQFSQKPAA